MLKTGSFFLVIFYLRKYNTLKHNTLKRTWNEKGLMQPFFGILQFLNRVCTILSWEISGRKHPFFKSVSYVKYLVTIFQEHNFQAQDQKWRKIFCQIKKN